MRAKRRNALSWTAHARISDRRASCRVPAGFSSLCVSPARAPPARPGQLPPKV